MEEEGDFRDKLEIVYRMERYMKYLMWIKGKDLGINLVKEIIDKHRRK